jgi:hypothetical protein
MNNKIIDYIPYSELMSLVKQEIKSYDSQGYINDGDLIPTVMYCNEKLGIHIHEVKQAIIEIKNNKGDLPKDFHKVFYMAALSMTNTTVTNWTNPWDNSKDRTVTYDADFKRGCIGCEDNVTVIYKKSGVDITQSYYNWQDLKLSNGQYAYIGCPNINSKSKNQVDIDIENGEITTGFRTGEIYMMYVANMLSEEGEILIPFHPLITPWYVWSCVDQVIKSMIFDTDEDLNKLKMQRELAQDEKDKSWITSYNFANTKEFMAWQQDQKKQQLSWWKRWFRIIQ